LLKMAPHGHPDAFPSPHRPHLRPAWMIRIGLFMYDHLGKRTSLPGSSGLRFGSESVLKPEIVRGFEYSDCWVDASCAGECADGGEKGGEVKTRTRATLPAVKTACGLSKRKTWIPARNSAGKPAVWSTPPAHG
jgi:glycerol-3-phosphate dehydrogenase